MLPIAFGATLRAINSSASTDAVLSTNGEFSNPAGDLSVVLGPEAVLDRFGRG
jgi:hypothetical protein